jgi:hypothetical protein
LRFADGGGSIWWSNLNQIRSGEVLIDARWLEDNIIRKVGNMRSTLFWEYPWLNDILLARSFSKLFELAEKKLVTVEDMFLSGWEVDGGAWK